MATYIWVGNFTEQGMRTIKETTKRSLAARELAKKFNVTIKDMYWTVGQYDLVAIFEAPDAESVSAFGLTIGLSGNLTGQTLRAFNKDQMDAVLAKVG
jgi:uncharacterized protein with GYD domain